MCWRQLRRPEAQKPEARKASYSVEGLQSLSGHLLTCRALTVRRCRDVSKAAHLSSRPRQPIISSDQHQPGAVSRSVITLTCSHWLASHFKRLRPTTHSVWRWIQLLPYLSRALPGGHIPFSSFVFFLTGHCLFWLLVPDNISLLFYDAEEMRVWERTDRTWKECNTVCVHNKHKHLKMWRLTTPSEQNAPYYIIRCSVIFNIFWYISCGIRVRVSCSCYCCVLFMCVNYKKQVIQSNK